MHLGLVEMDAISFVDVVVLDVHRYLAVVAQVHHQELIHNDATNRDVKNNGEETTKQSLVCRIRFAEIELYVMAKDVF